MIAINIQKNVYKIIFFQSQSSTTSSSSFHPPFLNQIIQKYKLDMNNNINIVKGLKAQEEIMMCQYPDHQFGRTNEGGMP